MRTECSVPNIGFKGAGLGYPKNLGIIYPKDLERQVVVPARHSAQHVDGTGVHRLVGRFIAMFLLTARVFEA